MSAVHSDVRTLIKAEVGAHELHCSRLADLQQWVQKIEAHQADLSRLLSEAVGARRLVAWLGPIVTTLATTVAIVLTEWFVRRNH
jgi:hypothetical protein